MDIDSEIRVEMDLEIECWKGEHFLLGFGIGMPTLVVWGLGIPLFALIMLIRNSATLKELTTKEQFGFLYNGYKKEFYFWEIVIMYRKIIIIFISVFLSTYGVITQALVVFIMLIVFLTLNIKLRPFMLDSLNELESISIVTQLITIYCGFFFISDISSALENPEYLTPTAKFELEQAGIVLSEAMKIALVIVILGFNAFFFTYWAFKMYQESKNVFRKKAPFLYTWICLCGDKNRYKAECRRQ